ncbi:uncharacterized protein LOC133180253 [Saccostrea echinata]|uniref:uncharacterized protein LOC133180253 n=1 Tax=Saccostrea echinata TaxID=191078 RepID=UPI002A80B6C5|nr:uncharacterized protein LOC133180253 [Saccostrea echinata]
MPLRSKKYSQKIKVIKYKEEGKEIEFVKSEPKCSGSKKPKKIATEELLDQPSTSVVQEDVRTYVSRKTKEREGWETVQPSMLRARIEEMCPSTWECCFCGKETMHIIYCPDCGPTAYYCETCCTKLHSVVLFHKPCVWKNDMYVPYENSSETCIGREDHKECPTTYTKILAVISLSGHQHKINMQFCKCEKESITLVRYRLWPSSPETPRVAFDFKLMELAVVLQLEGHLSLKSFCDAIIQSQNGFPVMVRPDEVKDIYKSLVGDSFNEYRFHRSQFNNREMYEENHIESTNECPICSESEVTKILSLDGNFGLVHKKSSGEGSGIPRRKERFFMDQDKVDAFVSTYGLDTKKQSINCSDFQAGNIIRSKKKTDKLDITGLFGSVCQHDIPQIFLNLKHGERLAYSVHLLQHLVDNSEQDERPGTIMYDIACSLKRHLQKENKDLQAYFKFVVPVFHSYAHNMACQLEYGQRFVEGTGLNDGEGVERLWSYLRKFSSITKEMTVSNRQHLIVDALEHYSNRIKEKLGERLKAMLEKAKKIQETRDVYTAVEAKHDGSSSEWFLLWKELSRSGRQVSVTLTPDERYCWLSNQIVTQRTMLADSLDEDEKILLKGHIQKTESELKKAKKTLQLDVQSLDARKEELSESAKNKLRHGHLKKLQMFANERQYILSLLKKYFDGQEMTKRISKQLSSNSERIKKCLKEFNSNFSESFSFAEVSIPTAAIYKDLEITAILDDGKIKACQAYSLHQHAMEQEHMTNTEIKALLKYIDDTNQKLLNLIVESKQEDRYQIGRKHMLMMFKLKAEELWIRYLLSLSEFSAKSAESQIHSFIDMPLQTDFVDIDCIFGEVSDLSESDESDTE